MKCRFERACCNVLMYGREVLLIVLFLIGGFQIRAQESAAADSTKEKPSVQSVQFSARRFILPASLISVGAIGTAIDGMNDFHLFNRKESVSQIHIDDYLEWGMLGWVFGCDLMGKEKHNVMDQFFLLTLAESMNAIAVHGLKNGVQEMRPDGTPYSFPSGHTANAFLGAHLAYKEFKDSSPVLAYSGYAVAAFVAASRLYNNRHWVADVVSGAGFGILSVELSYMIYFPVRNALLKTFSPNTSQNWILAPTFTPESKGFYLSLTF